MSKTGFLPTLLVYNYRVSKMGLPIALTPRIRYEVCVPNATIATGTDNKSSFFLYTLL